MAEEVPCGAAGADVAPVLDNCADRPCGVGGGVTVGGIAGAVYVVVAAAVTGGVVAAGTVEVAVVVVVVVVVVDGGVGAGVVGFGEAVGDDTLEAFSVARAAAFFSFSCCLLSNSTGLEVISSCSKAQQRLS